MALRAVWIIPLPGNGPSSVIFSRKYPTVEKRAKILGQGEQRNDYVRIPHEEALYKAILEELGLSLPASKFISSRDGCNRKFQKPIFEITINEGKLWPVIIIEKIGVLYCCLPLVDSPISRPPLIDIPGISTGFSLLFQMTEVLGPLPRNVSETHPKLQDLYSYLCQAAPFGTIVDANPLTVRAAINGQIITQPVSPHTKQPAWRPVTPKTKPHLLFATTEQIRAVLYNKEDTEDVYQLYGTVTCKAELDGAMPEVSMNLTVPLSASPLENLIIHPCVAATDPLNLQPGELTSTVRKFHFNPPSEMFILCHYTASAPSGDQINQAMSPSGRRPSSAVMARSATPTSISRSSQYSAREPMLGSPSRRAIAGGGITPLSERSSSPTPSQLSFQSLATPTEMPIKAAYEMMGDDREVQVKFRLQLNGSVKNYFEYFEVQFPFFNRGVVVDVNVNPSMGNVVLSQDRHRLGWNLGQKLSSRTQEASLQANVQFASRTDKDDNKDSFCVGLNTYALLYFKVPDYTHSGCSVEARSVQVQPSSKVKVTTVREFLSSEYKIWNSQGDVLSCLPPVQQET